MKHTNFLTSPMNVRAFLDSALDEDSETNDWREKARQLRLRRWRKISEHGQAVSEAIFTGRPYRRARAQLQAEH